MNISSLEGQIGELILYAGKTFALSTYEGSGLFSPANIGLKEMGWTATCRNGFHCKYEVRDQVLYLTTVHLYLKNETFWSMKRGETAPVFGKIPRRYYDADSRGLSTEYIVDKLHEPIHFSGGMLIGRHLWHRIGHRSVRWRTPTQYEVLHELIFEDGKLIEAYNRSDAIAEYHDKLFVGMTENERAAILEWLRDNFRADYKILSRWITHIEHSRNENSS